MELCSKSGLIVGKSHVIRDPAGRTPRFVVSLNTGDKTIYVLITQPSWITQLKIFTCYTFNNLEESTFVCESECDFEMVDYYKTAELNPSFTEHQDAPFPLSMTTNWHHENSLSVYEGVVTCEMSHLGIFTIDNKINVNVFLVLPFVQLKAVSIGQKIKLYNACCYKENEIVLCGRSYIEFVDELPLCGPFAELQLANVVTASCGLLGHQWIENQFIMLRRKFHVGFLKKNLDCDICNNIVIVIKLLLKLISISQQLDASINAGNRVLRDFLLPSHACILNSPSPHNLTNYGILKSTYQSLERLCQPFENEFFVGWNVTETVDLIGYLDFSTETGHWTLRDSTQTITCITPANKPPLPETLCSQFILVHHCQVVVEKFYTETRELLCTKLSLLLSSDNVEALLNLSSDNLITSECDTSDPMPAKQIKYSQNIKCALCGNSKLHECPDALAVDCCEVPNEEENSIPGGSVPTQNSEHLHLFVLHYVGTPFASSATRTGCHALVSVLQNVCHSYQDGAFPCILVFPGHMLRNLHFLPSGESFYVTGTFVEIQPIETSARQFVLTCLVSESGVIYRHTCSPPLNWSAIRDNTVKDLHFVEGVIVERKELLANNLSERISCGRDEYGMPGCKNLMLMLYGEAGTNRIYFNSWQARRYPLGMVPGATVFVTMLSRITAKSGNTYFQTTKLSSVTIVNVPDMRDFSFADGRDTLPAISSLDIVGKGLIQTYQIITVSITAMCRHCPQAVYRNYCCPNIECEHSSGDTVKSEQHVTYVTKAKLFVREPEGKYYVIVRGGDVRDLLELPSDVWEEILCWSQREQITFRRPFKDEVIAPAASTLVEAVRLYCMTDRIKQRTVAVYCKRSSKESQHWMCLEFIKLPAV